MRSVEFWGKTTSCHTQALLTGYSLSRDHNDLSLFEILTTVPFGIKHVPNDPNRLIDSVLDPDIGLDRALDTLGIQYRIQYEGNAAHAHNAIERLRFWLTEGPVVLGPMNMGSLPYFFHGYRLFANMDHYIVVIGEQAEHFVACDPEGFPYVFLTHEELLDAWRGDDIPEGRGYFVMRQLQKPIEALNVGRDQLKQTILFCIDNLQKAQQQDLGGAQGLAILARNEDLLRSDSSLRRGLSYVIPTRLQRLCLATDLIALCRTHHLVTLSLYDDILSVLHSQIELYGQLMSKLDSSLSGTLQQLGHYEALLEQKMASLGTRV